MSQTYHRTAALDARTVFVLGAGFTRAFVPGAPLLTDDYEGQALLERFHGFQHATRVLELECSRNPNGLINIERLLTRLEGGMPYDEEATAARELALLSSEVRRVFVERIRRARTLERHTQELGELARLCVENEINCLTFNYDDIFDQALWEVRKAITVQQGKMKYWHPDGGYGFFCRPSMDVVSEAAALATMDRTSMLLLKLHGAVNWRIKRGHLRPYSVDALVHHQDWLGETFLAVGIPTPPLEAIELHLDSDPFFVPPVLLKSALVEQPILRLVWTLAFQKLQEADEVFFVGYSLPLTDISAEVLFGEGIRRDCRVTVVNHTTDKEKLQERYHEALPGRALTFDFSDARVWARNIARTTPQATPETAGS